MNQIRWRAVQCNDLNGTAEHAFQIAFQGELGRVESGWGLSREEDADVDVAASSRFAPRDAAEQVDGHRSASVFLEKTPEAGLQGARVHGP